MLGDRLAPKQDWKEVFDRPGMKSLTMQGFRTDDYPGFILTKVEPSKKVEFGVYIEINDHYELISEPDAPTNIDSLVTILSERWQASMQRGLEIANKIVSLGDLNK